MVNLQKYSLFLRLRMIITTDDKLKEILQTSKTIAVVGFSSNPTKAAHIIPKHMQSVGYNVIPINPFSDHILGKKAYNSIEEVDTKIDILNIFRPSAEVIEVVQNSLNNKPKYIWMQLGIENTDAAKIASDNRIDVIMNKCIGAEYDRLMK